MATTAAITVKTADEMSWDDEADVVVIGYGGAGACAALAARQARAEVIIVDRFGGGGSTIYSGGVIYAGGTRYQHAAGFDDDARKMFDYLSIEIGNAVRPETIRRYSENSASDLDWLVAHGVRFGSEVYEPKTNFPPEGKYLYYSGNEKAPEYAARTSPMPRGHRVVGPGYGGRHYFAALAQAVEREGIRVRRHAKATSLIVDQSGRVIGIQLQQLPDAKRSEHQRLLEKASPWVPLNHKTAERAGLAARQLETDASRPVLIRARSGVILATGSFAHNPELLRQYEPFLARHYPALHRLGTLGSDGSGIGLGQSVGGAVDRMNSFYVARTIAPPNALLEGIIVNSDGARFINEDAYAGFVGLAIAKQSNGASWLILPAQAFWRAIAQAMFGGWHLLKFFGMPALINVVLGGTKRGNTLERLAAACGINAQNLQSTARAHDGDISAKLPDAVGKSDAYRAILGDGPFYAINVSISNRYAFTYFMTLGGLVVDEETGAVLRSDGRAVAGLYAAGLCAVGLHSNGYISGISLADGIFSGRRAGYACAHSATAADADRSRRYS